MGEDLHNGCDSRSVLGVRQRRLARRSTMAVGRCHSRFTTDGPHSFSIRLAEARPDPLQTGHRRKERIKDRWPQEMPLFREMSGKEGIGPRKGRRGDDDRKQRITRTTTPRQAAAAFQSRHRGTKELDLILGPLPSATWPASGRSSFANTPSCWLNRTGYIRVARRIGPGTDPPGSPGDAPAARL